MKKSIIQSLVGLSVICSALYSCDGNGGQTFATKEDSLSFAQAVMQKYPGESPAENLKQGASLQGDTIPGPDRGRNFEGPSGMEPISWQTVQQYSASYDKSHPLKSPSGYYYKGFSIDTAGYAMLLKQTSIKGLFLRLGQKADGSYTIMVLGLDNNGKMVTSGQANKTTEGDDNNTNYDNLTPCPVTCPE